jgi:hypothetical protein
LNHYYKQITLLCSAGKLDENDLEPLNRLRSNILGVYSRGKINEKHYDLLNKDISDLQVK